MDCEEHVVEVKESLVDDPIATPRSCEQSRLPRPFDAWGVSVAASSSAPQRWHEGSILA